MDKFEKLRVALRYYLQGAADVDPAFRLPLRALEFAMHHHVGVRKDGFTPEFMHQLETTLYLRTLRASLLHPAETLAAMLLHDTAEDYDVSFETIGREFGGRVAHAVNRLTKVHQGIRKTDAQYFEEMLDCPIATLAKGADRINNQQTMQGVFSTDKQLAYIEETERWILPMIKTARRRYPEQENAYENVKLLLRSQIQLLQAINRAG